MVFIHQESPSRLLTQYDCKTTEKVTVLAVCRFFHKPLKSDRYMDIHHDPKASQTLATPGFITLKIIPMPKLLGMTIKKLESFPLCFLKLTSELVKLNIYTFIPMQQLSPNLSPVAQ